MTSRIRDAGRNTRKFFKQIVPSRRERGGGEAARGHGSGGGYRRGENAAGAGNAGFGGNELENGLEDGRGFGLLDSPSALLTLRMERYRESSGKDTGARTSADNSSRRLPTRAVGYESEATVVDKDEKGLIRVARLANRGARGSAEASEMVGRLLSEHIADVHLQIEELQNVLKQSCATVEQLPDLISIDFQAFQMPKTEFEVLGEENEERYFRLLDFETGIWELEAMITERCYHQAVSIVDDLQQQRIHVDDDLLLTRLETATEVLCKELQPRGDAKGCASQYSQLLARLKRPAEARRVLLDDASLSLHNRLEELPRGMGTSKFLRAVASELYLHLCEALRMYKGLAELDPNALPTFMAWFVAEIDSVYDELIGPQIRTLKEFKLLGGCITAVLTLNTETIQMPAEANDLHSVYSIRLAELLSEDVCKLLLVERKRVIDIVSYSVRHETWEPVEAAIEDIIEQRVVKVVTNAKISLAQSCRVLCMQLSQILRTVSSFRLEGIYVELVRTIVLPLEAYSEELSRQNKPQEMKTNHMVLASVFVPYAIAALEETLSYGVPDMDQLRRFLLGRAGPHAAEEDALLVKKRSDEVITRGPSVSRWKPGRVDSLHMEREQSRKAMVDEPGSSAHESLIRELVRQKMREERSRKDFI